MWATENGNVDVMNVLISAGANQNVEDVDGDTWLHYAVYGNCSKEVLEAVIDLGADVNATNKRNETALMLASWKGNVDAINVLISAGADQTIESISGKTWLHYAVDGNCSKEVLQAVIDLDADVNATNKQNETPLMWASFNGNVDAMNVLISAGANQAIQDVDGDTYLHYAVHGNGSKEVLQAVIDLGADVNATNKQNTTALMVASSKGNEDAMNVLISAGANHTIQDAVGMTWLHYAVHGNCSKEVLQAVIDLGADVNATNNSNITPLMLASRKSNVDAMNVLVSDGANQTIQDVDGDTYLHYAVHGNCSKEVLQAVIDLGANVNATKKQNTTALMVASSKGNVDAMNVLVSAGANQTIQDVNGDTWLHYAVHGNSSKDVLQTAIDLGADVNAKGNENKTALMWASQKGNIDAMNVLISAGADQTIESISGKKWLHYAVHGNCSKEVLQTVIDLGADVNATNNSNITPLMWASRKSNVDAMNVLVSAGANQTIQDVNGDKWLHHAVHGNCSKEVLQTVIDLGANVNATNNSNITPLMWASRKSNVDAMNVLVSGGADQTIVSISGDTWLHYAVHGNCSKEVLQTVIDLGADVNATNNSNITPLMVASCKGNVDAMNVLVSAGANQTIEDVNGDTWLHYAVHGNCSKDVLQTAIDLGADVNAKDNKNKTALMWASQKGNVDAMNVLIGAGADQTIECISGTTWLHYAVLGICSKEVLQAVIDLGADVNATNNSNITPLMLASRKSNVDAMNVLVSAGANQTIQDVNGDTWPHYAVHGNCSKEVLQTVIDLGADVNATNKWNTTSLMLASSKGNVDAMNVLISAGADQTIESISGMTFLHYAVHGNCSKEVLQTVIDLGADVNATNKHNETALMLASRKGNVDAMNLLISVGVNRTIENADGDTWLHYAVDGNCSKEVLQAVIDLGANVNAINKHNGTSLILSSVNGDIDAMNILSDSGVDANTVDVKGDTLLHIAIHKNVKLETLQAIIDHGADVNATNKDGATALILACNVAQRVLVKVLLTAGADTTITDASGDTCLHKLFQREFDQETLQMLLDYGIPVDATNKHHQTAYALACDQGNVDAMCALVNAGASPGLMFYVYTARHLSR